MTPYNSTIDCMKTNAPGQLLGYTIQYFRALLRLLQCKLGESVAVEHTGDVSQHGNEGVLTIEEDKSSLKGNPVGDLSINLWKTFYNWIQFLLDSNTDVAKCRFVLYVLAPSEPRSLLQRFAAVNTHAKANSAIKKAKEIVARSSSEDVKKYADFVLNEHQKTFRSILLKLDVEYQGCEHEITEEIFDELRVLLIPEGRLKEVFTHFLGWVVKKIVDEISNYQASIVSKDDFIRGNRAFIEGIREKTLQDYTHECPPTNDELESEVASDKVYVRQLQAIEIDSAKMLTACSDYLRAGINRQRWIENDLISFGDAEEFERKLCSAHEHEKERIDQLHAGLSDIQKGKLLLNACEGQQVRLANRDPVDRTIQGTYHHLSDARQLGWHPNWKSLFNEGERTP